MNIKKTLCLTTLILSNLAFANNYSMVDYFKTLSYKEVIKKIKNPAQVEKYIQGYLIAKKSSFVKSFKKSHEERTVSCATVTVAAAALLSDDGYPATFLLLGNRNDKTGHEVFYYKDKNGLYGSLGIDKKDCNKPRFKTLDELAGYLGYDAYAPLIVGEGIIKDWITTPKNLWISKEMRKKHNIKLKAYLTTKN